MKDTPYFDVESCDLSQFEALVSRTLDGGAATHAVRIQSNVPVYDVRALSGILADPEARRDLMAEWGHVLGQSSGALMLEQAYADTAAIDAATKIFEGIIADEKAAGATNADHFAAGTNDRIWNAAQKLCLADPETFALYFGNDAIAAVCEAWLGPSYQMTAQVNLVHPGGAAQTAHRDYHLGFQTAEEAARFPPHVHALSAVMTLQGAIAHCDMPVASGPTKLLPFSQLFPEGYMAYRRDDFRALFEARYVQLPLKKGDALFFNPALFHAAGENLTTDVQRMANLLQVSSALGRAMEAMDRAAMCAALYPALQALDAQSRMEPSAMRAAIAAAAEGYSFPTNLDRDPPVGGLAPESQAAMMTRMLGDGTSPEDFHAALEAYGGRRLP